MLLRKSKQHQEPSFNLEGLKGSKVVIRRKRPADAATDYAWRCDPELARLNGALPLTMPFSVFLESYQYELERHEPDCWNLAIETLEGKRIGSCVCRNINEGRAEAEFGIIIGDRSCWDKGYGTDAIRIVVSHLFRVTNLKRLYLHTLDWNLRAQKCFKKCGFVPCGKVVRDGNTFVMMELHRGGLKE